MELQSAQSMRVSLESIRRGEGGLDAHRTIMLQRVPEPGDWAKFPPEHLKMKDLAYLTAKTGHEFAILRGKTEDILFHGKATRCTFDDVLENMLLSGRLRIFGHSHPGEEYPTPSPQDRETLKKIGQDSSWVISARTGMARQFNADPFENLD